MSKQTLTTLSIESIVVEDNVRIGDDERLQIKQLAADIAANGLTDRLEVHNLKDEDGSPNVLARGHRRLAAIQRLAEVNPEAFTKHFAEGIPVVLHKGSDRATMSDRKADHGNMLQLSHWIEVVKSVGVLLVAGLTQKAIVTKLAGIIDLISPMKPKKRDEFDALEATAVEAEEKGDHTKAAEIRAVREQKEFEYRRGFIQGAVAPHQCPEIVMASLLYHADEPIDPVFEGIKLPALRSNDLKDLKKAHDKDMETLNDKGFCDYSRKKPGPAFDKAWEKVVAAAGKREADKASGKKAAKAMSAKEIQDDGKKLVSQFARTLCAYHAGNKDVDRANVVMWDEYVYKLELVATHDDAFLADLIKRGEEIEKDLVKDATVEGVEETVEA